MERAPDDRIWYLAGPMTGLTQFNYPMFFRVTKALRNSGYNIVSPAEQDTAEKLELILASTDGDLSKLPDVGTWGDFLSHDVKLIADVVGGIILLPGWMNSRGARLEAFVALNLKYPFMEVDFFQDEMLLSDANPENIKAEVFKNV